MQFSTWMRGTAAVMGSVLMVASGAAPALAASAHDSIVQLDALDGQWVVKSEGSDTSQPGDNYTVVFVGAEPASAGVTAVVGLYLIPSPDLARPVVQAVAAKYRSLYPGMGVAPSQAHGDSTDGLEIGMQDANSVLVGQVFVIKSTVVIVVSGGPLAQSDFVTTTADTLASAQEALLSPGA